MDAVSAAFPEVEAQEADAEVRPPPASCADGQFITLAALNKGVTLRLAAPLELGTGPARADGAGNLFVCSNLFGWILVADNRGELLSCRLVGIAADALAQGSSSSRCRRCARRSLLPRHTLCPPLRRIYTFRCRRESTLSDSPRARSSSSWA